MYDITSRSNSKKKASSCRFKIVLIVSICLYLNNTFHRNFVIHCLSRIWLYSNVFCIIVFFTVVNPFPEWSTQLKKLKHGGWCLGNSVNSIPPMLVVNIWKTFLCWPSTVDTERIMCLSWKMFLFFLKVRFIFRLPIDTVSWKHSFLLVWNTKHIKWKDSQHCQWTLV